MFIVAVSDQSYRYVIRRREAVVVCLRNVSLVATGCLLCFGDDISTNSLRNVNVYISKGVYFKRFKAFYIDSRFKDKV